MVPRPSPRPATSTLLLDLDGVVWLSNVPINGSVEAVSRARRAGWRVVFVTNNSSSTVGAQEAALEAIGIPAFGDVVTSATAAGNLVQPGERVLVCGGPGVVEAAERRGAIVVDDGPVDAVIVGFDRGFDYEGLRHASTAVRNGARLIGTNDDPTYPTGDGPIPGGGAILASVAVASGATPVIAGKPFPSMVAVVRDIIGSDGIARTVMVGDRPSTDGSFARSLGCRYAQVWSGVTDRAAVIDPVPDLVGDDLAAVVDLLLVPLSDAP